MTPENEKRRRMVWLYWFWWCLFFIVLFVVIAARADSTFVPIEPPKPTICQKVCPVCGGCVPIRNLYGWGPDYWFCSTKKDTSWGAGSSAYTWFELEIRNCDSIIWGKWRQIYRVDTVWRRGQVERRGDFFHDTMVFHNLKTDTIYTTAVGRLDSTYVLPHDTVVCYIPGHTARNVVFKNIRHRCDTTRIPGHWEYYNWVNGKRVNMRRVK